MDLEEGMGRASTHQRASSSDLVDDGESDDDAQAMTVEDVEWEDADSDAALPYEALQAEFDGRSAALEVDEEQADEEEDDAETEHAAGLVEGPKEVIEKALAANRRLQSRLAGILAAVDSAIWRNAETQAKLMHKAEAWPRAGRYKGMRETSNAVWGNADVRVVGPSRFWVADRRVPEPNEDALRTAPAFQYLPHAFRDASWVPQEHERLQRAILQAVNRAQEARTLAAAGRPGHDACEGGTEEQSLQLDSPGVEAEVEAWGPEQWAEVARLGSSGRSGRECATEWAHRLRPSLNLSPWSVEEDAKLAQLQARLGMHSWEVVARELGTGRTAATCLSRFQRCHNAALLDSKWTADDAARLAAIVAQLGTANWPAVAAEMGNRTAQQVQHYYRDNLQGLKKGVWSADEDAALLKAVETCGRRWREVAKLVPRRSDKQCRERFCNVLDPDLKREDEWAPEEDAALRAAIAQHSQPDGKVRWAKVGAQLSGRTDNSCWRRSKTLAAMERGTHRQACAPRGSGGRFCASDVLGPRRTPRETGSGPGGLEAAAVGDNGAAVEPGSEDDRTAGGDGTDVERATGEDAAAVSELAGGRRMRGRRRGKRAAKSSAEEEGGPIDEGESRGAEEEMREEGAEQTAAGIADSEEGRQKKKPRKRARR